MLREITGAGTFPLLRFTTRVTIGSSHGTGGAGPVASAAGTGEGLACYRVRLRREANHPVGPPVAVVHHAGLARFLVDEEEERVPHELHFTQRLIDAHRRGLVHLLPNHHRGVPQL